MLVMKVFSNTAIFIYAHGIAVAHRTSV